MLSDDSSSDSETGRFKCQTKPEPEKSSTHKDSFRSGRSRPTENDRFRRDFERKRDDYDKRSRDRHRFSRHSPIRRKPSRERSPRRRSDEKHRHRDTRETSKTRDRRSDSRDRRKRSRSHKSPDHKPRQHKSPETKSRSHRSPEIKIRSDRTPESRPTTQRLSEPRRDFKEEIKRTLEPTRRSPSRHDDVRSPKHDNISPKREMSEEDKKSSSPDFRGKRSEVYKPPASDAPSRQKSPVVVEVHSDSDKSEEVQLGSYYNMIPAVVKEKSEAVKEKSEASSEIDSSDDERLRAKLLNLEKELQKTRKKKHKKKHKRKSSKSSKDRDVDEPVLVEVTSTTDIESKRKDDSSQNLAEAVPEVSSTQKSNKKESSEEGEISSDDEIDYDPSDLRHKLRRSKKDPKADVCGPALPPHLEKRSRRSSSLENIEGPALPPHLQNKTRHHGPSIPEGMRIVLAKAEREVIKYESSEDDGIGPLPVGAEDKWSTAHQRLEQRALDIKIKRMDGRTLDSQKIKTREEWMLELPEGKAKILGLEARSFRAKAGPDMSDRSSWTDTPEDKARKAAGIVTEEDADTVMRREARLRQIADRDEEQEMAVKKHKKKHRREESLLEQHQKKLKKKKKKEEKESDGKKERRPFSRDVDLQVNRFDEAQKKSIIKKAQDLDGRFSQGEARFL